MTAAGLVCGSCGTEVSPKAKFCSECGSPIAMSGTPAEYKQVTVLFADVVGSMDIAATVGAERLREIMAELVDRATAVVTRYGGTVDKFTGDGIMAVFGAPAALEDHALRACLAALGIQEEVTRMAAEVDRRDGVDLRLRVGLNSGQVITGEIGSAALGYTAIGVGCGARRCDAQRIDGAAGRRRRGAGGAAAVAHQGRRGRGAGAAAGQRGRAEPADRFLLYDSGWPRLGIGHAGRDAGSLDRWTRVRG